MSSASALDGQNRPPSPTRVSGRSQASPDLRAIATTRATAKPATTPGPMRPAEEPGRDWLDHKATDQARRAAQARQASGRRRLVDPATCERDYSQDELDFMQAMQAYKQSSGRMFPTWSEVLEVLMDLGYAKLADPTDAPFERQPA